MKTINSLATAFLVLAIFTFSKCKKENDEMTLPPETAIGAMTFGCKINGKVFVPRDGNGRPGLYVQYVNLGNVPGGGWHLNIPAIDWKSSSPILSIHIETDSLLVLEGMMYSFKNSKGNPIAFHDASDTYLALDNSGNLFIKKHDQVNHILSGTFSFVGTNSSGQQVHITEGRFDIRY